MAIDSRYKMSQERLDTLKEELHYLETTREKEVAELIKALPPPAGSFSLRS